jgi:hypothetical protein
LQTIASRTASCGALGNANHGGKKYAYVVNKYRLDEFNRLITKIKLEYVRQKTYSLTNTHGRQTRRLRPPQFYCGVDFMCLLRGYVLMNYEKKLLFSHKHDYLFQHLHPSTKSVFSLACKGRHLFSKTRYYICNLSSCQPNF